jgi:hypothetical protein
MSSYTKRSYVALAFGLILMAATGYGLYRFFGWAVMLLNSVKSEAGKAIVTAGGAVTVAILSSLVGKLWEQKVRIQEEVRQRKQPIYEDLIQSMFKMLLSHVDGATKPLEQDTVKEFAAFTEKVVIWGGPEVIKKWSAVRLHDWSSGMPIEGFLKFEAFIKAIRKELGNSNSTLVDGDFLRLFINDLDPAALAAVGASAPTECKQSS